MRTTVTLDDDVFQAAQAQAQASGQRLGKALSVLVRRGLKGAPSSAHKNGLPVFNVPSSAEIIPSSRAGELLAEELP